MRAGVGFTLIFVCFALPVSAKNKPVAKAEAPVAKVAGAGKADAEKAEESGAKTDERPVQMLVRVTDFMGTTTLKVVSPEEYREIRHDIDKDNEALRTAYMTIRREWKASGGARKVNPVTVRGQQCRVPVRGRPLPFPLPCPPPKEARMVGQFKDPAALDEKKNALEAKEEARQSKGGFEFKRPKLLRTNRGGDDAEKDAAELMSKLLEEIERIRQGGDDKTLKRAAGSRPVKRVGA